MVPALFIGPERIPFDREKPVKLNNKPIETYHTEDTLLGDLGSSADFHLYDLSTRELDLFPITYSTLPTGHLLHFLQQIHENSPADEQNEG